MPTATLPTFSERPTAEEVRNALLEQGHAYAQMRQNPDVDRNELRERAQFIQDADLILTAIERGTPGPLPNPGTGILPAGAVAATSSVPASQTIGQRVTGNDQYRAFADAHAGSSTYFEHTVEGGSMFRATITSDGTGADGNGGVFRPVGQPIVPDPRQMRFVLRQLLDVQNTTLAVIPYIQEVNPLAGELGASAVAEGTAKPEVAMDWTLTQADIRKIAAWVPVTTEIIDDAPTLMGYIDGRLAYLLAVREEFEILNGPGTAPRLKGILQYAEIQTQTFTTDQMVSIGRAIGKIENVDGEADGMAMNALDYWDMVTTRRADTFDGGGGGPLPFANVANMNPWGLPTVRSRAITRGTALVGAWRMGATLWDRQQTVIRVGNQHSDYFVNNKVAVLAEERVGLAVHRPDFFCKVPLS